MRLTLYLQVIDGSRRDWIASNGELWTRMIETAAAPAPGSDGIVLWSYEEADPVDGPVWDASRRYMAADGSWHVDLVRMVVDPSEEAVNQLAVTSGPRRERAWHTSSDGDLAEGLRRGGWTPHRA